MFYYAIFCIIWGLLSVYMQKKYHPLSHRYDLILNFIVNTLIAPISMIAAIYRFITKTGWAQK